MFLNDGCWKALKLSLKAGNRFSSVIRKLTDILLSPLANFTEMVIMWTIWLCDTCRGAVVCQLTGEYYLIVLPSKLIESSRYVGRKYKYLLLILNVHFHLKKKFPLNFGANKNIQNYSTRECILVVNVKLSAGFSGHLTKRIQVQ